MTDTKVIEALSNASSLELFELSAVIDRLLADPKRIGALMGKLHVGKAVRFMDWRSGEMRAGTVVEMKGKLVTVHELGTRLHWKQSYAAIEPGDASERFESATPAASQVPVHQPGPQDFRRGDKVSFTDKYLQPQVGTVTRINQRTASVDCEGSAGWRVPFAMLRHLTDI